MLLIIGGLWVPILMFVAFVVKMIAVTMMKYKQSFYVLLFIMPFGLIYKYPGFTLSFLTVIEILMICVIFFRMKKINATVMLTVVAISLLFALRMNSYYMAIPKLAVSYLIMGMFIATYEKESMHEYADYFVSGIIFSSFLGIFKERIPSLLAYYNDMNYDYVDGKLVLRFSGLFDDPNYFSIALICAMIVLIYLKRYQKYPLVKFYVFFAILTGMGLLTYSKSFILIYAFVLLLEVILNLKGQNKIQSIFEILIIGLMLVIVFLGEIEIVNRIFSRFTSSQGLTTGRDDIWRGYWAVINQSDANKWFGLGLDAPYVGDKAAHSLYVEMIYYSGYIGLAVFMIGWLVLIFNSHKNKIRIGNLILPIIIFIMYAFLSGFLNYAMPFYMIFAWMLADMDLKEKHCEVVAKA